jgi:anti-anti-sigma regulatory factor
MPLRPPQGHPRPFHCCLDARPETVTLLAAGTLGVDAAHELDDDLRAVRDLGFRDVVLDLRAIQDIAPAGVALILRWIASASLHGRSFRVLLGPTAEEAVAAVLDGGAKWAA